MKADEQLKCKDCDWYGSCEYYDRRKETSQICKMFNNTWKFVAELEKIKAEINTLNVCDKFDAIGILDDHIAELKGKIKESEIMDKQAGWNEYKNIKETLESLLDKGYTKEMIQTVLEQIDISELKGE